MSRIIVAYNPDKKISDELIKRFSLAEKFVQGQTPQKTCVQRMPLLAGHVLASIILKKDEENKFFVDPITGLAVFLDGGPLKGAKCVGAKNLTEGYLQDGPDQMPRTLDGSWCAVIIDPRNHSVLIFRDRFGHIPFYFSKNDQCFFSSSSPGALVRSGLMPANYEENMIARYASSNYRATYGRKQSFFKDISLMEPSTFVSFKSDGTVERTQYWIPDVEARYFNYSDEQIEEEYRNCLLEMIKKYYAVNQDKDFGITLSGGIDSGTIIGLLHKESQKRIKAISMTYHEKTSFDERDLISCSVRDHVSDWAEIKVEEQQLLDDLPGLYSRFDIPLTTVTAYCHEILFKEAVRYGMPVIFTGAGGDALQAGTYPCYLYYLADLKVSDPVKYKHELNCWIKNHGTEIYPKDEKTADAFFSSHIDFGQKGKFKNGPILLAQGLLDPDFAQRAGNLGQPVVDFSGDYLRSYSIQELWFDDVAAGVEGEDVMCWSWGVEVVSPFFDEKVVDFGWCLPPRHKIRDGVNKVLARKALRGIVPDEILDTVPKKGFNAPFDFWVRGSLKEFVMDHLMSQKFQNRGIYDQKVFRKYLNDHMNGKANHMMLIWQALNLELWLRHWIDTNKE